MYKQKRDWNRSYRGSDLKVSASVSGGELQNMAAIINIPLSPILSDKDQTSLMQLREILVEERKNKTNNIYTFIITF